MAIVGTRPEVIKVAPVIASLRRAPDRFEVLVVATAQHRELLDQSLSIFQIKPDIDLNVMQSNQGLAELTGRILAGLTKILKHETPDIVLVQGDTTSVFAGSLAAFYEKIPVAHIEAGLRTHNKHSPFPEEMNRRLTTAMTDVHFAPTPFAKSVLLREGVAGNSIIVTGNTVVDALMYVSRLPCSFSKNGLAHLDLTNRRLLLVTSHRRESWGKALEHICGAIKDLVARHEDILVVYPVHPNPVVKHTAVKVLAGIDRVYLVDPLDYITFVHLMKQSYLILTDSGGLQEEAPTLKKPLLLLRDVTERPDGFVAGLGRIIGTDRERIVRETESLLNDHALYQTMICTANPYGDGRAADRIAGALWRWAKGENPLIPPADEFDPQCNQDQ